MCYVANLLVVNQATVIRMVYKKLRTPKYTLEDMVKVENGSQSKDYRFFLLCFKQSKMLRVSIFTAMRRLRKIKLK